MPDVIVNVEVPSQPEPLSNTQVETIAAVEAVADAIEETTAEEETEVEEWQESISVLSGRIDQLTETQTSLNQRLQTEVASVRVELEATSNSLRASLSTMMELIMERTNPNPSPESPSLTSEIPTESPTETEVTNDVAVPEEAKTESPRKRKVIR